MNERGWSDSKKQHILKSNKINGSDMRYQTNEKEAA